MNDHILNPDTQVTLLLCGRFGQLTDIGSVPLANSEYNKLVLWMKSKDLRPSDLLKPENNKKLGTFYQKKISVERIRGLLNRSMAMAFAVEEWANRGIWVISRSDTDYPARLKSNLKGAAPSILYGVGNRDLLNMGGLAILGSRNVDEDGLNFTRQAARVCACNDLPVVSGGARGVDREAMFAALDEGGNVVGVLPDGLAKAAVSKKYRKALKSGNLALFSATNPEAGFSVGNAMGRNTYIYAMSDYCLVISSASGKGGTWSGAVHNLKKNYIPLFVRHDDSVPRGNLDLIEMGGIPLTRDAFIPESKFRDWLEEQKNLFIKSKSGNEKKSEQLTLFDMGD
ncbi:MAG: DNA-processing protein DprA [Candidatus Eremiobacteraeota bacterium]|nr:DNA-processing protein DprA [Candidatus Eremiobacteraeota bacterium]